MDKKTTIIQEVLDWRTKSEEDKLYFIKSYMLGWTSEEQIHRITSSDAEASEIATSPKKFKIANVILVGENGTPYNLSAITIMDIVDAVELKSHLKKAKSADDFLYKATQFTWLPWQKFEDTESEVVVVYTDKLGNKKYLKGIKA